MKVKEIMSEEVITVTKDATIEEIAKILIDHHISGVPVVDDENHLLGIVTEGDLIHQETAPRLPGVLSILGAFIYFNGWEQFKDDFKKLSAKKADEIMTSDVIAVKEDMDVQDIAAIFINKKINRAPVLRNKKIIGIVSRADILKVFLSNQE